MLESAKCWGRNRAENGVQCGVRGDFNRVIKFGFIKRVTLEQTLKEVRVLTCDSRGGRASQEEGIDIAFQQ